MKFRYRIIGILLLVGIYFGYREDPGEQYVMVYRAAVGSSQESGPPFPVKVSQLGWASSSNRVIREDFGGILLGYQIPPYDFSLGRAKSRPELHWFVPADIESAEKIEAYLKSG